MAAAKVSSIAAYLNLEPELAKGTVLHLTLSLVGLVLDALQEPMKPLHSAAQEVWPDLP